MDNVLYTEEAVREMLLAAYKAGFEGPMEMAESVVADIMQRGSYEDSDVELIEALDESSRRSRPKQKKDYIYSAIDEFESFY